MKQHIGVDVGSTGPSLVEVALRPADIAVSDPNFIGHWDLLLGTSLLPEPCDIPKRAKNIIDTINMVDGNDSKVQNRRIRDQDHGEYIKEKECDKKYFSAMPRTQP